MTTAHVFIATSLDGYIARKNGDIDWLVGFSALGEDHGYDRFISRIDAIVMGRGSFEKVATFSPWPYDRPVLVLSNSLSSADIPHNLIGKVEIIAATPGDVLALAEQRGWRRVYVDGGATITSFLREGLIADMVVSQVPVLIGDGLRLFGSLATDIALELEDTMSFPSGLVQCRYRVKT